MEQKPLVKRARDIVRPYGATRPYSHKTHIVLFSEKDSMDLHYVQCFEEQVEAVFLFLRENGAETITVIRLGRTEMTYDATIKQ